MSGRIDIAVIGGGPAGLAAAIAADKAGAKTLLVEREARLGGILKQCIHDGFGLLRFGEKLSGPEYAFKDIEALGQTTVEVKLLTFVTRIEKCEGFFRLTLVGALGIETVETRALILSTGCRERTARQIAIHGTRPAGVITAGAAQYYTNILGQLPCKRCVILGSGDIGLIMARRLTLEGAKVIGVYEAKPTPSGLSRNIAQCLEDFDIPLYTSRTVTRVFGRERLEAVEIASVDEKMRPIPGTTERIACDGLILSVGLIPENELAESLGVPLENPARGPICDQHYETLIDGIFSCGNALQVNDLADYVSESGECAGRYAADFAVCLKNTDEKNISNSGISSKRIFAKLSGGRDFLSLVPQRLNINNIEDDTTIFFRAREERGGTRIRAFAGEKEIFSKTYNQLRPPEMERITLKLKNLRLGEGDVIQFIMEDAPVAQGGEWRVEG
ncbi:MAG: NAD(P)/FAD-dependent oxidoreductase [Treponema sp.]|jgi:thioredoxin reductase|nr:NAD(P)/FAD-dependent oxidoreductase [Treponema sp.]